MQPARCPDAVIFFSAPYSAAVANLGFQRIWERLDSTAGFFCDRAVWDPRAGVVPRGLHTRLPLSAFPLIFISSSFDLDLIEVVSALRAGGIEVRARQRSQQDPVIVAGGITLTLNPHPWTPILDLAILGEGEDAVLQWLDLYLEWRRRGGEKAQLQARSADLPFVWLPGMPRRRSCPAVYSRYRTDPACSVAVHPQGHFGDCFLVEITRGCPHRCPFCAVRSAFPARFAAAEAVLRKIEADDALGAPKIGLVGAAAGDHPELKTIVRRVVDSGREITVSSLRAEKTDEELLEMLVAGGFRSLTVAPEAGGEELRFRLGKKASDDDLIRLAKRAGDTGLKNLRLYFIIGMPEPEPPEAISDLVIRMRREAPPNLKLDVNVSAFIPKAGTPWEEAPFASLKELDRMKKQLREALRRVPGVRIKFEAGRRERLAALISRGDARLGEALVEASASKRSLEQQLRLSGITPDNPPE